MYVVLRQQQRPEKVQDMIVVHRYLPTYQLYYIDDVQRPLLMASYVCGRYMQPWPYGVIVLYVCKQERRKNPKTVIMIDRLKARVGKNPKKRDRL